MASAVASHAMMIADIRVVARKIATAGVADTRAMADANMAEIAEVRGAAGVAASRAMKPVVIKVAARTTAKVVVDTPATGAA